VLLSVPQVDVVKDWLDYTNLVFGLGGFAAAIVAIILARHAQRSADTAITEERRRVFELDILRALMKDLDEGLVGEVFTNPQALGRYRGRLSLLSSPLPFWERLMVQIDFYGVMQLIGLGAEFSTAEGERDKGMAEERLLKQACTLYNYILTTRGSLGNLSPDQVAIVRQSVPYDVTSLGSEGWRNLLAEGTQRLHVLSGRLPELTNTLSDLRAAGMDELQRRMSYDVQQEIWARVEGGHP
jgi:hypothetical protein